jgi:hypothetical protein
MREAFSFYEKCQKKLYMLNANLCPLIFFKSRNTNNFVRESFSVGRTEWQIAYFPGRRHRTSARDAAPAHHRRRSLHRTCGPGAGVTAPSPSTGEQPAYLSLLSLSLLFQLLARAVSPSLRCFARSPFSLLASPRRHASSRLGFPHRRLAAPRLRKRGERSEGR